MLNKNQIPALVSLLRTRNVRLYHACNLLDFKSYLHLSGIPSRALLMKENLSFTKFTTDSQDQKNGVWDKVFLNLSDLGEPFAKDGPWTPIVYGPILLVLQPDALNEASDVAVCLRSAGGKGFNRDEESLNTVDEVNRLFASETGAWNSHWIKFATKIAEEFGKNAVSNPEVSLTIPGELMPLIYIEKIVVDAVLVQERPLVEIVREATNGTPLWVEERTYKNVSRRSVIESLSRMLHSGIPKLAELAADSNLSPELRTWARDVIDKNLAYQFNDRYAPYLRQGTILPGIGDDIHTSIGLPLNPEAGSLRAAAEIDMQNYAARYRTLRDAALKQGDLHEDADDIAYTQLKEYAETQMPNFDDWWPEIQKYL